MCVCVSVCVCVCVHQCTVIKQGDIERHKDRVLINGDRDGDTVHGTLGSATESVRRNQIKSITERALFTGASLCVGRQTCWCLCVCVCHCVCFLCFVCEHERQIEREWESERKRERVKKMKSYSTGSKRQIVLNNI